MKRLNCIIIFILVIIILPGCSIATNEKKKLSNEEWIEDINYLDNTLKSNHPDLFKYISQEKWDKSIDTLKSDVNNLSDKDTSLRIAQIITSIGDVHTFTDILNLLVPIGEENIDNEDIVEFPIKVEYFEDGLRVVECDSKYKEILGYKLISINNVDINEIIRKISTLMSHDYGNEQFAKEQSKKYMNVYEILRFLDIIDENGAEYVLENDNNEKIELKLNPLKNKDINYVSLDTKEFKTNEKPQNESDFYWYKFFPEDDTLFLKFNRCSSNTVSGISDTQKETYPNIYDFLDRLMNEIDNGDFNKLVIDVRENPGGSPKVVDAMIETLKYRVNIEDKNLFVITGKRTGSAAVEFADKFQDHLGATVVGEETGGSINLFNTLNEVITLPNSKLDIASSYYFKNRKNGYIGGLKPDVVIKQTYQNYLYGTDDCYEYIRTLKVD